MMWGRDRHALLTLEEAWEIIAGEVVAPGSENVPIGDAARRVLAAPVVASDDYPAFDKAMMDGFAVRSADCDGEETTLRVVGLAPAGSESSASLQPGEAIRINTGAPVPAGADAVVMVEQTSPSEDDASVVIKTRMAVGRNIERRGAVRRRGDVVLTPPTRLGPIQLAAAITAGVGSLPVYPTPGAAIVVTGDELVSAGRPRRPGQIHESNGPMLAALMSQFAAAPTAPIVARDETDALRAAFEKAMCEPVVLAVGGMSMGTLDLVPKVLESLGVRWLWHGVAVRPGKPAAYGRGPNGQHVFGLPGNPLSAFVCAWLFVRMVIDGLQGLEAEPPRVRHGVLAKDVSASRDPRPAYVPARVTLSADGQIMVSPCDWRGSGDPFGAVRADALMACPGADQGLSEGSPVSFLPI